MYNYPEGADLSAYKESFTSLCLSVFDIHVEVDKVPTLVGDLRESTGHCLSD